MNANDTTIIFGPPGTGKTTSLLELVSKSISRGIPSERIMFIAFTRRAANEAKERAVAKFQRDSSEFPLFRTIHSLAFRQLGLQSKDVMTIRDYIEIAKTLGLYITARGLQEDGTVVGLSKGDRLLFMDMMSRARMLDLREYWEQSPNEDINYYELEQFSETLKEYKSQNHKIDFVDVLYQFLVSGSVPPHDVLFVDEAQDLSPLQWQVIRKLSKSTPNVFIAGDDDQAIFTWAGADVNEFIFLQGTQRVLSHSHRVPKSIQVIADGITSQIDTRVEKRWVSRDDEGEVHYVNDISQIDMSHGSWLLLARNMYLLDLYVQHCVTSGFVFDAPVGSPTKSDSLAAIVTWENLRKNIPQPAKKIWKVYDQMSVKVGVAYGCKKKIESLPENTLLTIEQLRAEYGLLTDKIWHEALDKIQDVEREYFLSALRRGEKLLREPRIKINTIHSVKGGEADNVVLITDMAQRSWLESQSDPDSEHRVWYVGVTRARQRLFIVQPTTSYYYSI